MWIVNSSVGRKFIMSITGLFLVLFLTFHSLMNATLLISANAYNAVCEFLGANWYAVIGSMVLALGFVVHIVYATWITLKNRKARGNDRYAVTARQEGVEWSSQNMYVLGLIILGFLILHLYNFWFKMQFAELTGVQSGMFDPANGAAYVTDLFSNPIYCLVYIVWLAALWFHLTHGIWSGFQTLGWDNKIWLKRLKVISNVYATIVILIFMAVPLAFIFGYNPF
jgi:succinate dehydrogenase / fumarate reductase cytochrome b subunit